ncbi:MAG: SpoIIE family protein phosphatase [Phycisphaerae bacterium]|nr:SpoIIE family protein phosphatase [Phycisphaerae bacterium]
MTNAAVPGAGPVATGPAGAGVVGTGVTSAAVGARAPEAAEAPTITDFITDGSLAGLCEKLTGLLGVEVTLRDTKGRRIVRSGQPPFWAYAPGPEVATPACGTGPAEVGGMLVVPLCVEGMGVGSLVLGPGEPRLASRGARDRAGEVLELLATTAAEVCHQQLDLRSRLREMQALFRLSSMLAKATRMESVLDIALESALEVLDLDAGSIVLFDSDEGMLTQTEVDLVLKGSRNLSREWLESPLPLSKDRVFDRLALGGEIVVSTDLRTDDRVLIPEHVEREGLRAAINAGLVFQGKPIGVLRLYARSPRTFTEAEKRLLRSIAHQAAVAVEQARLLKMQERDARIQRQVELAADVQRRMLPRWTPQIPRLDVAARYVPSFELGGDFYDFYELSGNFGLAIGDVVGKGIAAALLMSGVRSSLRAHVQDLYDIDVVLSRVNAALCRDTRDNEFATLWYGVIDPARLRMTYCSGGHEPPLVVRRPAHRAPTLADIDELSIGGMAVGIDPSQRYQRGVYDLHPGDVILAYTDGVTDTLDFAGKRFGKARLRQSVIDVLTQEPDASAARVAEHLFWELRQFAGILERPDDQTVVVVRVRA